MVNLINKYSGAFGSANPFSRSPMNKVGILAVFWSFWGPEDYILFQENILPVFRSLSNPKFLALRALDFVHSSTPNHWSATRNPWHNNQGV